MQMPYFDRFIEAGVRKVGLPYLWGKSGPEGYDCSGLVKGILIEVGGPDHRTDWNSQRMFDVLAPVPPGRVGVPCLAFFGADSKSIHHVGIALDGDIHGWFLEAAGGDQTTNQPTPGARVYLHRGAFWGAAHFQGYREIPGPVA
jgi:cell wall-associated NlpC family hydrolase